MEENPINIFLKSNEDYARIDVKSVSPISLAYIGDAVFELLVRTYLFNEEKSSNKLHRATANVVKAKSQAKIVLALMEHLSEEELSVVRRGRNAKSNTVPKNADIKDYRNATGLESLLGYLYLLGRDDRIAEIFSKIKEMNV